MGAPWVKHENEILGTGGTALIYRATRHIVRDHYQEACWKELRQDLRADPDSVEYFRREAAIATELRHQNIVPLLDADLDNYYLIFELIDGCDLRRVLEAAGGRLSVPATIYLAIEICQALDFAHTRTRAGAPAGIIHRDLCPKNILISHAGEVRLMDFGCAAISSEQPSTVRGKLSYMSPEQARGEPLDGRADLFSLGVVLFEVLTGRRPYDADGDRDSDTFARLMEGSHESLTRLAPEVPEPLDVFISQLLRPSRDHRVPSAEACLDILAPLAPSRLVRREFAALSLSAYKRRTKDYAVLREMRKAASEPQSPDPKTTQVASDSRSPEREANPAVSEQHLPDRPPERSVRRWAAPTATLALVVLIAAVAASEGHQAAQVASPPSAARSSTAKPAPAHAPNPTVLEPSSTQPSPESSMLNLTSSISPPARPAESPLPRAEPERPTDRRAEALTAMLHINAAPPTEVWIDKRSYGNSPVHAHMAAGWHVIAAGSQHRRVHLRPHEEHDEFFDLTHGK